MIAAFVAQILYMEREAPPEIIVEQEFDERSLLEATLAQRSGHKVRIASSVRGIRARWLEMMHNNAEQALKMRNLARSSIESSTWRTCARRLDLEETPQTASNASTSVTPAAPTRWLLAWYSARKARSKAIIAASTSAAFSRAMTMPPCIRRSRGATSACATVKLPRPDMLLIDGGKGQLAEAAKVLEELGVAGVTLIGVAKGADRRPGQEQLFLLGRDTPTILAPDSRALHLIQRVRDEAHRFAITGHRRKRAKRHSQSILETSPGLGPVKRRELLKQFGGLQGILACGHR